jgi:zinc protease
MAALFLLVSTGYGLAQKKAFFPYKVYKETLENGLDVIIIPTPEFKNVLSYNTLVLAGSRNELERGKTGLAHLFEHILFRHRFGGEEGGYERVIDRIGAHNNAWTWFDVTFYHPLTFTQNLEGRPVTSATNGGSGMDDKLPGIAEVEASRFTSLDFNEKIFKTETGAVLGEYRKSVSNPGSKVGEKLLELAFTRHPYGHTTIGYGEDVLAMPKHYEAALAFYNTYYRPNNSVLIVSGDVDPKKVMQIVRKYYSNWERREVPPVGLEEPPQTEERRGHVTWDADVPPRVTVAYKVPRHRSTSIETAVGQLLPELLVSESAPLFQKLRYEKKTASALYLREGKEGYESFDPRLISIEAVLFKDLYKERGRAYLDEVIADIIAATEALQQFSQQPDAAETISVLKNKYRYDLLAAFSSPAAIAQTFAWYYRFERDPQVFDNLVETVTKVTPTDVDRFAQKYFVPTGRTIVTLTYGEPK